MLIATPFVLLRVPLRTANWPLHGRRPGERVRKASELRRLEGTRARSWTWSRLGDLNPGPTHYEPFASPPRNTLLLVHTPA